MGERMTGADAAWLHMDRPTNRMIVNMVAWFEGEPDWDAFRKALHERWVDAYPRFRQKVREPALPLTPLAVPECVDDPGFRFENHIHTAELPAPGDERALHDYVEAHASKPLPRDRPLWQIHLISGYQGGGAVLLRASHALGDGTALMHGLLALADDEPHRDEHGPPALVAPPVEEDAGLSGIESVRHYVADGVVTATALLRGNLDRGRKAAARVASLTKLAVVQQDRKTVLRRPLGTRKSVTWTDPVPLDSVRQQAKDAGVTINDLLLSVIAAAVGRYLREHGSDTDEIGMMLPFNLRSLDEPMPRGLGNKFGLVFPMLPVKEMDQRERIIRVHDVMERIKLAKQAHVVFTWISWLGTTPAAVERVLIDRYAGMSSLIVTNVPGPRHRISIAGSEVSGLLFWVPTSGPVGVGLSLISYAGDLIIGIMVDAGLIPDAGRLRELLDEELQPFRAAKLGA